MDRADVGMVQARGRLSFSLKTGQRVLIFGHIIRKELQGNETMEAGVLRLVDDTHAPAAKLIQNAVTGDRLADE